MCFPTNYVFNIENSQLHLYCDLKRLSQKHFSKGITNLRPQREKEVNFQDCNKDIKRI